MTAHNRDRRPSRKRNRPKRGSGSPFSGTTKMSYRTPDSSTSPPARPGFWQILHSVPVPWLTRGGLMLTVLVVIMAGALSGGAGMGRYPPPGFREGSDQGRRRAIGDFTVLRWQASCSARGRSSRYEQLCLGTDRQVGGCRPPVHRGEWPIRAHSGCSDEGVVHGTSDDVCSG